jgi:hypothetical protein
LACGAFPKQEWPPKRANSIQRLFMKKPPYEEWLVVPPVLSEPITAGKGARNYSQFQKITSKISKNVSEKVDSNQNKTDQIIVFWLFLHELFLN